VGTKCGWFSDRSSCYLASGRPVVVQDTGFVDILPTGNGLFSVAIVEEAADAIRTIRLDYKRHAIAARNIASE
jgi:glycosyltransferase involved in cell wall biosynthesis